MYRFLLALCLLLAAPAGAETTRFAQLYSEHLHPLSLVDGELQGPGAAFLRQATARAQFVALGEDHDIREIPPLATALFRLLQAEHGFEYFATEQDPLSLERLSEEPRRGRRDAALAWAARYPYGFSFATDQELRMLGDIAADSRGRHHPLWGAEQAMGVGHYLEELATLAEGEAAQDLIASLLARAQREEARRRPLGQSSFMADDRDKRGELLAIRAAMQPREGSRAAFLLDAMLLSDEIYHYWFRAEQGEIVGLWNNWVREDWMKQRFAHHYRLAQALDGEPPRVLLKYGGWHIQRGRGPGSVFTLGSLVHELALFNGREAFSISLVPYPDRGLLESAPTFAPFAPLLPESGWVLVDLRPFRPHAHAGTLWDGVPEASRRRLLDYVFGFDAAIFMPGSGQGSYRAVGLE